MPVARAGCDLLYQIVLLYQHQQRNLSVSVSKPYCERHDLSTTFSLNSMESALFVCPSWTIHIRLQ